MGMPLLPPAFTTIMACPLLPSSGANRGRVVIPHHALHLLPPAGGGWVGGAAPPVLPAHGLTRLGFPPPRLPPLGGEIEGAAVQRQAERVEAPRQTGGGY